MSRKKSRKLSSEEPEKNRFAAVRSEEGKPALVPKLRFPEFRSGSKWPQHGLGEKAAILKGKGIAKSDLDPNGPQACIRYGELYTRYGETIREAVSRTKVPASELFLSKADDVIIPSSGETKIDIAKASCVLFADIALGGDLNVIRSKLNGTFLSYYLNGPKRVDIAKVAQGDTVVHLYPHQLEALRIAVPSAAEQQKIAECLSSVDELIAAQVRKVNALKVHKKGLMQQLFPREGEPRPQLRFRAFLKAAPWELRKIGDMLVETQRPIALSDEAEYCLVTVKRRYGGLVPREILKGRQIMVKSQFKIEANDFLISKRQIVHDACGLVPPELDGSVVSNEYSVLTPKAGCSVEFFSWFAMQPVVSASFMKCSVGIVIEKMLFKLPAWLKEEFLFPTMPEQQRIADCLTSLDALITAEAQKLEVLKTHKKGLMQQLFPSPEEVEA